MMTDSAAPGASVIMDVSNRAQAALNANAARGMHPVEGAHRELAIGRG